MVAMATVKEEVADMLSEIRNILSTNKPDRSRERMLCFEPQVTIEV